MTFRTFKRQFTDNNKYGEYEKVPYMNALAHVVEEYVYSDKLDDDYFSYNMTEEIPMFDFMTLVAYFISESHKEFGKSTIVGYIEDLKSQYQVSRRTRVEYPDNNLLVTCASNELIIVLLWTTFIYLSAYYMWSKNEKYADMASMVYGVMLAESGLNKMAFLSRPIVKNMDSAKKLMLSYMVRSELRNRHKKESAMEVPVEDASNLQARIEELKAVIKQLSAEKAELKQQLEKRQNNETCNEELEAKQDEKVLYNKVSHEFFLRLLEKAGLDLDNTGNKTRVGDLWHMVTGKSGDEIRRYCSTRNYINPHTRVDIKRLNDFLQDMMIGDFQLPIS